MAKNLLQDMVRVKREKRQAQAPQYSAQNIYQEESRPEEIQEVENRERNDRQEFPVGYDRGKPRYKLWFVALVSLSFLLFSISYVFSKATVTVIPKKEDLVLNENLSASLDSSGELPFDLIEISGEENKIVQTAGEKDFSQKAQGLIVMYNAFSAATQTLNIDTKLEGSNEKIYKTQSRIVVPGMNKDGKPGSVEVKIYGAEAGEEYNSAPLDFKIVNFKGSPKYEKFYGRSKGAISGGLKGKFSVIPEEERIAVVNELKVNLQASLSKKAASQIPEGFILYKNAAYLSTDENSIDFITSTGNNLPIKLTGTLYGILLDEKKLTKKIAEDNIKNYDGSDVVIPNIRDLIFTLGNGDNISFGNVKNIDFKLSGPAKIIWKLDAVKLSSDLLGKSRNDFKQILLNYPNINSADLVLSPIWKMSLPDDTKKIKVIVNNPK